MASPGGRDGTAASSPEPSTFPNPADISNTRRLSASSRQTDEFTDYGEAEHSVHGRGQRNTYGESSISRPGSAQTGVSSRANTTTYRGGGYAGSVGATSTRPPTAQSRTHVPSLTASAFYRPMSSQRLQAQRGQRPPSAMTQNATQEQSPEEEEASHQTRTAAAQAVSAEKSTRPLSRGTEYTEFTQTMPESSNVPELPVNATEVIAKQDRNTRSRQDSDAPLQNSTVPTKEPKVPGRLDLNRPKGGYTGSAVPRSPRTLASFIPNRHSKTSLQLRQQGHEKLPSDVSSPKVQPSTKEAVKRELGKNYEYFQGNTVFCLGGRLQNTKDKPINLITAFLLVLPVGLFFGFS
jgi:palmitoyltransferase ZDHHC9/14/18